MNRLPLPKRLQLASSLVEGNSLRSIERMADVSVNTAMKFLVDLGTACHAYHDEHVRGVRAKKIQCDEIWAFCGMKDKALNIKADEGGFDPEELRGVVGSVWTWTGIEADTKLMIGYHVGVRDAACAAEFINDLASRLATRVQLTTDGHKPYLQAVEGAFGCDIDYAMLIKLYGNAPEGPETRYSPAACIGARKEVITGEPNEAFISTSYVERSNLTMRMGMRRFTRLTNAFSKKVENHGHAVALHFLHYNFVRIHKTLRTTPAMAAGLADHVWTMEELIGLVPEPVAAPWGSRRKAPELG